MLVMGGHVSFQAILGAAGLGQQLLGSHVGSQSMLGALGLGQRLLGSHVGSQSMLGSVDQGHGTAGQPCWFPWHAGSSRLTGWCCLVATSVPRACW